MSDTVHVNLRPPAGVDNYKTYFPIYSFLPEIMIDNNAIAAWSGTLNAGTFGPNRRNNRDIQDRM